VVLISSYMASSLMQESVEVRCHPGCSLYINLDYFCRIQQILDVEWMDPKVLPIEH